MKNSCQLLNIALLMLLYCYFCTQTDKQLIIACHCIYTRLDNARKLTRNAMADILRSFIDVDTPAGSKTLCFVCIYQIMISSKHKISQRGQFYISNYFMDNVSCQKKYWSWIWNAYYITFCSPTWQWMLEQRTGLYIWLIPRSENYLKENIESK